MRLGLPLAVLAICLSAVNGQAACVIRNSVREHASLPLLLRVGVRKEGVNHDLDGTRRALAPVTVLRGLIGRRSLVCP
jgi:hypothetical protein